MASTYGDDIYGAGLYGGGGGISQPVVDAIGMSDTVHWVLSVVVGRTVVDAIGVSDATTDSKTTPRIYQPTTPQRRDDDPNAIGCVDDYTVIITARDLRTYAAEVAWSDLTWSRTLDDISEATITVPDRMGGLRCNVQMGTSLVPWRFGIRIERNGALVWCGPITNITRPERDGVGTDYVEITAQDKMAWMRKRTPTQDLTFDNIDAGFMFRQLIEDATSIDNAFNLFCPDAGVQFFLTREVVALDFEYVYDILDDLARSAVDFFMIGEDLACYSRNLKRWEISKEGLPGDDIPGGDETLAPTPDVLGRYIFGTFTEDAWTARPGFSLDGESQANDIFVPGADSGLAGFRRFWRASDVNVIDGLLQYVDVNPLYRPQEGTPITSEGVFQERANSMLELRKQTPVIISGGALSQRAPVTVPDLFPGSLWVLDMADEGISSLVTVQRLKRVDVSVSKSGGGYAEKVSPTLMPLGTEE